MERDGSGIPGWESSRKEGFQVGMPLLPRVKAPASGGTEEPPGCGERGSTVLGVLNEMSLPYGRLQMELGAKEEENGT